MPDDPVPDDAPGFALPTRAEGRGGGEGRGDRGAAGIIHNRLRDWDSGNHPGYALGTWVRDYKEQVFLFTRDFAVPWTNNISERGAKAAKRHQVASGHWDTLATIARKKTGKAGYGRRLARMERLGLSL